MLHLGAEHVDDARERDLPEVDLFLEDQVQQQVERAFEDGRRDLVGHDVKVTRAESQACGTPRRPARMPRVTLQTAGSVAAHDSGLFRDQADR